MQLADKTDVQNEKGRIAFFNDEALQTDMQVALSASVVFDLAPPQLSLSTDGLSDF